MSASQRNREAEAIIELQFPIPSKISCEELVNLNALMNAEKTLLSNEVVVRRGKERKLAEAKLSALARQRKRLDEIFVLKKCAELEQVAIEKQQLDLIASMREDKNKSLDTRTFDDRTLLFIGAITIIALGGAYYLRKRG